MSSVAVAYSPQLLAEVHARLARGPVTGPVDIGFCPHGRIVLMWQELPSRLAAVLAVVGGVLFLMVSPTAPYAADHAQWLVRSHMQPAPVRRLAPDSGRQPRPRTEVDEGAPMIPGQDRRRAAFPAGQAV